MIKHTTPIRIRYADTDQMKFVYYGKYFEYFEQGRSDLLREVGLPYSDIEEMGLILPVIEAHAAYRRPSKYDDLIKVVTYLKEAPVARVRLDYEVFDESGQDLIADGYTIHSFVNADSGRPTRAPAQFLEAIQSAMNNRE
jgi:acyl-CoA thioester hydrolase